MITIERPINTTPVEDNMVVGRIVDIQMLYEQTKSFAIIVEVINGKHAGALLYDDKFHCTEQGKYYWKFQKLMRALGKRNYDENINLEKTLLDQYFMLVLTIFRTENRKGEELKFQNITYYSCPHREEDLKNATQRLLENLKLKYTQYKEETNKILEESPFIDICDIKPRKV